MSRQDRIIWEKEPNYMWDEDYKEEVRNDQYEEYVDEIYDSYGVSRDTSFNTGSDVLNRRNYDTDFADDEDAEAREEAEEEIEDFDTWYESYVESTWWIEQDAIVDDWKYNVAPMIDEQIKNGLILVGYRNDQLTWKNGGGSVLWSDASDLFDWLCEFDDAEITVDEEGNLGASGHDHDGSTSGDLYTFTDDRAKIASWARANGYEDEIENNRQWYSSSYSDDDILYDIVQEEIENGDINYGRNKTSLMELLIPIKNQF